MQPTVMTTIAAMADRRSMARPMIPRDPVRGRALRCPLAWRRASHAVTGLRMDPCRHHTGRGLSMTRCLVGLAIRDGAQENEGPPLALAAVQQRELLECHREVLALLKGDDSTASLVADIQARIAVMFNVWARDVIGCGREDDLQAELARVVGEEQAAYAGPAGGPCAYESEETGYVIDEYEGIATLTTYFGARTIGCVGDLVTRRAHFSVFRGDEVVELEVAATEPWERSASMRSTGYSTAVRSRWLIRTGRSSRPMGLGVAPCRTSRIRRATRNSWQASPASTSEGRMELGSLCRDFRRSERHTGRVAGVNGGEGPWNPLRRIQRSSGGTCARAEQADRDRPERHVEALPVPRDAIASGRHHAVRRPARSIFRCFFRPLTGLTPETSARVTNVALALIILKNGFASAARFSFDPECLDTGARDVCQR